MNKNQQQLIKLGEQLDKQRRLLQRVQCVYETERKEWARLLHDEFGQSLAGIKSFAVGIKSSTATTSDAHELAEFIRTTADELYVNAYDLMRGLRSGFIEDIGLLGGIQVCIENSRLAQREIRVEVQSEGNIESLSHLLNVAVLRIVQESLSGIVRSSKPSEIVISVSVNQRNMTERRKHSRDMFVENGNAGSTLVRKIIAIYIKSDGLDVAGFESHKGIFNRTKDYVEAFGGDYLVKQNEINGIAIQMNLDVTDLIEDVTE